MISGRIIKVYDDLERINEFLAANSIKDNSLNENEIIYILEENDKIIGACKIETHNSYGILRYIVVSKNFRGQKFGDGLLRAAFNYCLRNGIQEIYFDKHDTFLTSIGFTLASAYSISKRKEDEISSDEILQCNLEEFFSRTCKCKGRD